ncbi:MAG: dimethyl sulfoxide reductase anchor subunit [Alphaproteobacteria bacterium]|nr:dimethyl sulfoxide reductase anchor subunit [Alphaproteobacteria bacterium]
MHPAVSIIFFTTASGAGYGLLALMGLFGAIGLLPADPWVGGFGLVLALVLVTAGLASSTYHLGHPERAWRALSQWKTSWLSREGVMAILTYLPAALLFIGWVFQSSLGPIYALAGLLAAVAAAVTVYCTGMIYASLKPIRQWHSPLTTPNYLLLALLTGTVALNVVSHLFKVESPVFVWLMLLAAAAAWVAKAMYWRAIDGQSPATTRETATGLGRIGRVRPLELPNTSPNYLQKEMVFRVARDHARRLRTLIQVLTFAVPLVAALLMLLIGGNAFGNLMSIFALLAAGIGVMFERWLFFAEAEHTVGLYYNS